MELRPWQLLPDEMRTKEVRKYYNTYETQNVVRDEKSA